MQRLFSSGGGAPSTDVTSIWSTLGTIDDYISFIPLISIAETILASTVASGFISGDFGPAELVYGTIIMMISTFYIGTGYVIELTIHAVVTFSDGFYYQYAGASQWGDNLGLWELIVFSAWAAWAFANAIGGTIIASQAWSLLDERLVEAKKDSIGFETPLTWDKALKVCTLMFVLSIVNGTVAYSLANTADELVGWFDNYSTKTKTEGSDKDTGKYDADGTAAEKDIQYHLATSLVSFFLFSAIDVGAYWFYSRYFNINDDDAFDESACQLDDANRARYATFKFIAAKITT